MTTKICCTCKKEKPVECFSKNKNAKDGLKEYCKECAAVKSAEYREKCRQKINAKKRRAYEDSKLEADQRTDAELKLGSKVCTICKEEKPIAEFYKRGNGGFYNYCKKCANKDARKYYRINKLKIHGRKVEYNRLHKEEIRRYNGRYYLNHSLSAKIRAKKWAEDNYDRNIDHKTMSFQRVRSKKAGLKSSFTRDEWIFCKTVFGNKCAYCGKKLKRATQDHVLSIQDGGTYTADNIVPACVSCNSSKGKKDFKQWYRSCSFYSAEQEKCIETYLEAMKHADTERAT